MATRKSRKQCAECADLKRRDDFAVRLASFDGLATTCKECKNTMARLKYAMDPDYRQLTIERVKNYQAEHPR